MLWSKTLPILCLNTAFCGIGGALAVAAGDYFLAAVVVIITILDLGVYGNDRE